LANRHVRGFGQGGAEDAANQPASTLDRLKDVTGSKSVGRPIGEFFEHVRSSNEKTVPSDEEAGPHHLELLV
jgi:hypothetical protein